MDNMDTLPQPDGGPIDQQLESDGETKGARKVGTSCTLTFYISIYQCISHDLFVVLNTQDQKPLVAVPDEDEHLERRAAEVSKLLQDDSNDKDILKASSLSMFRFT